MLTLDFQVPNFLSTHKIVCTCKWAGLGTMTTALKYIEHAIAEVAGVRLDVHIHSMVDYDATCLTMLKPFKPQHLYSDLMQAFPVDLVASIAEKQSECLQKCSTCPYIGKRKQDFLIECVREFQAFVMQANTDMHVWPMRQPCHMRGMKSSKFGLRR